MDKKRGFITTLFDFSFSEFLTTKIIKILYGIGVLLAGLAALSSIIYGFKLGVGAGIGVLILSPLVFLLVVVIVRIYLEIMVVLFRIAEDVREMLGIKKG